jgi:hypothetical protein
MRKLKYLLLILLLIVVGCKKNSVTLDEFIEVARFNGYLIENNKTGYESYDYISDIYYAVNRENAYDVQFLKLDSSETAKKFFLLNVDEIKKNLTTNDYIKSKSLTNYELYHAENSDTYYLVIRSKENIIYISAPINYINEIEEFLEDLDLEY